MSNNKFKVLVVEDEANIRNFVGMILETAGYQVLPAKNYKSGMLVFSSHCPDLVILDLGLPDRDGLEFIEEIRRNSGVPIIILSARSQESDKVAALDLGANDYITKPFGTAELSARVRAALRNRRYAAEYEGAPKKVFQLKEMQIDYDRRQVTMAGTEIALTQTEYNILSYLSEHPGKVLTYTAIVKAVWGSSDYGSVKKLQVNIANIRKKLGSKPGENHYIINELGIGYRIADDV